MKYVVSKDMFGYRLISLISKGFVTGTHAFNHVSFLELVCPEMVSEQGVNDNGIFAVALAC